MGKDIEDLEGDNQSMWGFLCEDEHDMISETWLVYKNRRVTLTLVTSVKTGTGVQLLFCVSYNCHYL